MEWTRGEYAISDEPARVDARAVCSLLAGTYWAGDRTPETIERSLRHSLCFSLWCGGQQVGLMRVVTDFATVGYLCDVVIVADHRGKGLGKWMMEVVLAHPALQGCRIDLFTGDAQEFYRGFGFGAHRYTSMVRYPPAAETIQDA